MSFPKGKELPKDPERDGRTMPVEGISAPIPAVMMFNYFTSKIKAFDVEMENSSSELLNYFLKREIGNRR
ncbi:MAG TPA: hypothetical protein VFL42_02550 [Terriglobales bacterium]|nr:hypothetical protein [Terriglobales bacterium]